MKTIGSLFSLSRQFFEDAHVENSAAESQSVIAIESIESDADTSRPRIIRCDFPEFPLHAKHAETSFQYFKALYSAERIAMQRLQS